MKSASQRPVATSRVLSIAIHVIGLLFFALSFSQVPKGTNPLRKGFGGPYKFLTIIALLLSTITFVIGFLADVLNVQPLFKAKSYMSLCATPVELLITIFYWTLYAIDRTKLTPPGHQLPLSHDLGLHAVPTIMLLVDLLILSPPWPINGRTAFVLDLAIAFSYWGWIEYCFSIVGWYPYPGLTLASPLKKLVMCVVWAAFLAATTVLLKKLQEKIIAITDTTQTADSSKTK
ncbi:unnamed protein product [Clonostachys solani]|uniref:Integral membrane protein n=1 Tax=Clonostachys solani TaxID=160281 RepID=A0A9N9VWA0_9HYPO|nr:unnamed protein product [Clonostachys solani]